MISLKTSHEVLSVVLEHMSHEEAIALVRDLLEVHGSKSFRESVRALHQMLLDGVG